MNLDEHEAGCKPLTNPCRMCRVAVFLKKNLDSRARTDLVAWLNRNSNLNLNFDEHEAGCTPVTGPCRMCWVANFLREHIGEAKLAEFNRLLPPAEPAPAPQLSEHELALLDAVIVELWPDRLTVRTKTCLKNDNRITVRDLVQATEQEMLRTPNFGRKSLNELKELLAERGLHFGML